MLLKVLKNTFFKLMINSVHGKTENLRKKINVRLVNNEKDFLKYTSRPTEFLFTDTGSLTDEIKSEDFYEKFLKHKHLFNFSNYPKDLKCFDQANKKLIGKIKDVSKKK